MSKNMSGNNISQDLFTHLPCNHVFNCVIPLTTCPSKHIFLCMNKLSSDKRTAIITSLVEGNSIASTCRMTGAAKMTVLALLREVGSACAAFQDRWLRN